MEEHTSSSAPENCLICGHSGFTQTCAKIGGVYYKCEVCGLLISFLAEHSGDRHDRDTGYGDHAPRDISVRLGPDISGRRQAAHLRDLRILEPYRKLNRLLDIGCGTGGFLAAARGVGWNVYGTEIASACVRAARERDLNVHLGHLSDAGFRAKSFDAVRMHNVIEHLSDPDAYLRATHGLLRDGGLFLLSTVNMESYTASCQGNAWKYVNPIYHVHLFGVSNLTTLLEKTGFRVRRLRTRGFRKASTKTPFNTLISNFGSLAARILDRGHRMYMEIEKVSTRGALK